jgi:hypothetical protein
MSCHCAENEFRVRLKIFQQHLPLRALSSMRAHPISLADFFTSSQGAKIETPAYAASPLLTSFRQASAASLAVRSANKSWRRDVGGSGSDAAF